MAKLFLLRHLESQWNKDNRFAGWVDNPLSKRAVLDAKEISDKLADEKIDVVYTSSLIRNTETVLRIYENFTDKYPVFLHLDGGRAQKWEKFYGENDYIPVYVSNNLNERYYGRLQGFNKNEIISRYGVKKVHLWRRGFKNKPPGGESLREVFKRAVPFFKKYVVKDLAGGKNVLLVASHNSLRAVVKYVENVSDENVENLELSFGELRRYDFDQKNNTFALK